MILDIDTFYKLTQEAEKSEEPQVQTKFTKDYDETKVVDAKAMGLVKKRERKDLEKPVFAAANQENQSENVPYKPEKADKLEVSGTKVFKHEGFEEKINSQENK